MTADFRALCAEALALFDDYDNGERVDWDPWKELARAALAKPAPEGPTDEEIMELMPQQMRDDLAAAARALSSFDLNYIKAASTFRIILNRHVVDHARAVLTKWSHQ